MKQYHDLLQAALSGEERRDERTGAGTVGVFQKQARFDLNDGFPLVTTKKVSYPILLEELLWFLSGSTNIRPLLEKKVKIWTADCMRSNLDKIARSGLISYHEFNTALDAMNKENNSEPAKKLVERYESEVIKNEDFADRCADLGPTYGAQWRGRSPATFPDQVADLEAALRKGGSSRRMIVSAWNPSQLNDVSLPPCHVLWQAHVSPKTNKLSLGLYQRSADAVLGVPYNIASYATIAQLLAHTHGFNLGEFVATFADLHVYLPHIPAAEEQLKREPKPLPKLEILTKKNSITEYTSDDFKLEGYEPHPKLETPTPMYGGLF